MHVQSSNHSNESHVRHGVDYLRQPALCKADTNPKPMDLENCGVTGFVFNRKCRDIVRIIAWSNEWRTHDQTDMA
jgi:hypothetical protein